MSAESILTVSAAVLALTQILKWGAVVPDRWGPVAVLALAAAGTILWGVSNEVELTRRLIWPYFAGWVAVATSASGVYGFVRAVRPSDLISTTKPPEGVAQQQTGKI